MDDSLWERKIPQKKLPSNSAHSVYQIEESSLLEHEYAHGAETRKKGSLRHGICFLQRTSLQECIWSVENEIFQEERLEGQGEENGWQAQQTHQIADDEFHDCALQWERTLSKTSESGWQFLLIEEEKRDTSSAELIEGYQLSSRWYQAKSQTVQWNHTSQTCSNQVEIRTQ